MSKQNNPTGLFVGGLMIGSAVGTLIGLLIAPRTGKETRKVIKKSADALPELAEDLGSSIQFQADRLSESTLENWSSTLERLQEAIAAGVETSRATAQEGKLNDANQDVNSSLTDRR
ncbi:MAG: YtxH domain-containing protein [Cyanobacteria bacterium J06621_8]